LHLLQAAAAAVYFIGGLGEAVRGDDESVEAAGGDFARIGLLGQALAVGAADHAESLFFGQAHHFRKVRMEEGFALVVEEQIEEMVAVEFEYGAVESHIDTAGGPRQCAGSGLTVGALQVAEVGRFHAEHKGGS